MWTIKYNLWFLALILFLVFMVVMTIAIGSKSSQANTTILDLQESTHADLVDFLYEFAGTHRLNVLWFGWYRGEDLDKWYVRSERDPSFKIKLYMLDEKNGYLFFSNRFNEQNKANFDIERGLEKPTWLSTVSDMERELKDRNWLVPE